MTEASTPQEIRDSTDAHKLLKCMELRLGDNPEMTRNGVYNWAKEQFQPSSEVMRLATLMFSEKFPALKMDAHLKAASSLALKKTKIEPGPEEEEEEVQDEVRDENPTPKGIAWYILDHLYGDNRCNEWDPLIYRKRELLQGFEYLLTHYDEVLETVALPYKKKKE